MNPHGHIPGRQARDLANGCRVHVFEIRDDDLAIERLEPLNQCRQPVQIQCAGPRRTEPWSLSGSISSSSRLTRVEKMRRSRMTCEAATWWATR